uniref:Gamma-soluble NSF attachment protein n=1 Tax=Rhabditophanes sp. KR3021 TaxID=114890 RepID=A0AC35TNX3_9BILA
MSAANTSRIQEAKQCIARANEHLKTSTWKLKFKPEFDSAAMEYERAAVCYKNAEDLNSALDCWEHASANHKSNRNHFHEAKAKENAASLAKDLNDNKKAAKLIQESCEGYVMAGSMDTAAMTIDKSAKWFEYSDPVTAISMYEKGLALVQQSDRSKMAGEFMNRLTNLYIRCENYKKAIEVVEQAIDQYVEARDALKVGQLSMCIVLLHLAKGDEVAATIALNPAYKFEGFEFSPEAKICGNLIKAFEDGDDEAFQNALNNGLLKSLDNDYLRLLKKLKAPRSELDNQAPGDEEDEGIC